MSHGADEWSHQEDRSSADDDDLNWGGKEFMLELQSLLVSMGVSEMPGNQNIFQKLHQLAVFGPPSDGKTWVTYTQHCA